MNEETGGYYYELSKFFQDEHGLILLDSEIQDIIYAVDKFKKTNNEMEKDAYDFLTEKFGHFNSAHPLGHLGYAKCMELDISDILTTMDAYTKQKSISFIEWTVKNGWQSYVDEDRWICLSDSKRVIDTEQLYELYEKAKQHREISDGEYDYIQAGGI